MADLAVAASQGKRQAQTPGGAYAFLEQHRFFEPDPPLPAAPAEEFRPAIAVLLMTNQCQLRCTYCYAAAGEAARRPSDPRIGRAAIDYVCHAAPRMAATTLTSPSMAAASQLAHGRRCRHASSMCGRENSRPRSP